MLECGRSSDRLAGQSFEARPDASQGSAAACWVHGARPLVFPNNNLDLKSTHHTVPLGSCLRFWVMSLRKAGYLALVT